MVRKSELLKLENYLGESNQLVESLKRETAARQEYDQATISKLESELDFAHAEKGRLSTVISNLGKCIQNLERIIKDQNRNFYSLQSDTANQQLTNHY